MNSDYKKIDIKTKKLLGNLFLGNYKTAFKGRGLEFSDFRSYDLGDDAKRIDWLVSAREGKTLVRRYEEDRELDILFVLDLGKSMHFGLENKDKIDTLKEVFYLLGLSGVQDGSKIGAFLIGDELNKFLRLKKGKSNLINIFKEVENFQDDKSFGIKNKLDLSGLLNLKIKNTLIFVLTDKVELEEKSFKVISYKNDLVYINIFDNFENTLIGDSGIFGLSKINKNIFIDLSNEKKVLEYRKLRKAKIERLKKIIYSYSSDYLYLDNKLNIFKKLLLLMKRR